MSFAKLLVVLSLLPAIVQAADSPWSVDVDAGVTATRAMLWQNGLSELRGNRVLATREETVDESPALLLGVSPAWSVGEHVAVYGRLEWQRSQNAALHGDYEFWNGDVQASDDSIDRLDTTRAAIGIRWSVPVMDCWSASASGEARSMDIRQTQKATDMQFNNFGQITPLPRVFSQSRSATGLGAGATLACRLSDRWSLAGTIDYGRLEDYSVVSSSLVLRLHLR